MSVFGELQLTQISFCFKTSYCNLKIIHLWGVWQFCFFNFKKNFDVLKVKESRGRIENRKSPIHVNPSRRLRRGEDLEKPYHEDEDIYLPHLSMEIFYQLNKKLGPKVSHDYNFFYLTKVKKMWRHGLFCWDPRKQQFF